MKSPSNLMQSRYLNAARIRPLYHYRPVGLPKSIIFNTKFIIFNIKFIIFNAKSIIFNANSIIVRDTSPVNLLPLPINCVIK